MLKRVLSALTSVAVVMPLLAVTGSPTSAAPPPAPAQPDPAQTITLVTGDRILVRGKDVQPLPVKDRAGISYHISQIAGHTYVVPADAADAVAAGRLDRRLFDINALQELGYGQGADVPLIVAGRLPSAQTARKIASGMTALRLTKGTGWDEIKDSPAKVWLDGKIKVQLAESTAQVGAPAAWQAGYTGKGVTVAVLDTGIDATHPDFAGRITAIRNFTQEEGTDDRNGHGTHVTSILAGNGVKYRGVAPEASIAIGRVCETSGCSESAIIAGMEWAAREVKAQVVNLSLGRPNTEDVDPIEAALNELTAETGTLFVIAAGNSGPSQTTVNSPGTADAALSVGAVNKDDTVASYSSRGPRLGDGALKPEIAAPGTGITAARATNSDRPPVDEKYTTMSGTSMASPHVAGAAALLAQRHPDWRATELKSALISSAAGEQDVLATGAGRLDVARALRQEVFATTNTINFGFQSWPHTDDQPVERTVTYRNTGSEPVTLSLSTTGSPFFTTQQVTVPAGGQATVDVTADTRTGPNGQVAGRLIATSDRLRIVTPLTVNKEVESYDLTLKQIGRDGKPAPVLATYVIGLDEWSVDRPYDSDGTVTLRRPKGRFMVDAMFLGAEQAQVAQPLLNLDRDTILTLDARDAKLVRPAVRGVKGGIALQSVGYQRDWDTPDGRVGVRTGVTQFGMFGQVTPFYTAQYGRSLPEKDLSAWVNYVIAEPGPALDFSNSPYTYHLFWGFTGTYPTGFAPTVQQKEFARVRQHYHAMSPGTYAKIWSFGSTPEVASRSGVPLSVSLPFQRDEYYLAKGRLWMQSVGQATAGQIVPNLTNVEEVERQTLTAGSTTVRHWNRAVYGPSLVPAGYFGQPGAYRRDDTVAINLSTYSDGVAGRFGYPRYLLNHKTGLKLYRNGELVGESDSVYDKYEFAGQPAEQATYRAEMDLQVDESVLPLSSRVSTTWTFKSGRTDSLQPLPLMTAAISPNVDEWNSAKAHTPLTIPLTLQRNPGSAPSKVAKATIETSFDDGKTWRRLPVVQVKDTWYGVTGNAAAPGGYASLRITAIDQDHNKVEQTFIHAYKLR